MHASPAHLSTYSIFMDHPYSGPVPASPVYSTSSQQPLVMGSYRVSSHSAASQPVSVDAVFRRLRWNVPFPPHGSFLLRMTLLRAGYTCHIRRFRRAVSGHRIWWRFRRVYVNTSGSTWRLQSAASTVGPCVARVAGPGFAQCALLESFSSAVGCCPGNYDNGATVHRFNGQSSNRLLPASPGNEFACRIYYDDSTDVYFCCVAGSHDFVSCQFHTTKGVAFGHQAATL